MADSPPPFSTLASETLVTNAWHRYRRDRYVQTDGSTGEYFYIDMHGACAIVPMFADGDLLLIECERYLLGQRLWEFPIGGMESDESPLAAAQKELREETGYTARSWEKLGAFAPYKGVSNEITHVFLARDLTASAAELEPSESITAHRYSEADARERLLGQALPDGQSITALALLDRWRNRSGPK